MLQIAHIFKGEMQQYVNNTVSKCLLWKIKKKHSLPYMLYQSKINKFFRDNVQKQTICLL